ncbi:hypothetical protein [Bradyrhizobium japonicum]|uniref:hypothetical protein n=1 Tax=Bradyrhizobium japonicum TaxID=375 RepID=UPI0020A0585C|nr:hypothetical protein [Bradyrhizobium japonicum]MCP1761922.1 hypothetical protein [Bradyrhizobium japonicum]MCP1793502.1 hypothetical protein [Bradyrhizobium japonicum]MCP1805935.1 hypothetical protein [Bradyrhizobium japonicum]MCP1812338.1 hypothetical protein [Bradyrhizobium japonicum]MCP1873619.1 hypothetical protein [Bradyrhizobium japonicum]
MAVHEVSVSEFVDADDFYSAEVIRVARPDQLRDALSQKNKPVVIDDEQMAAHFRRLQAWQEARLWFIPSLIAALIAYSISQHYQVDLSWRLNWKVNTLDGKITLTPIERR